MCEARIHVDGRIQACGKPATKRINKDDDRVSCCDECFRRYSLQKDWYGWFDHDFPSGSPPGSAAVPVVKLDGCATCWHHQPRTACKTCAVELCRWCASVPPPGYSGDYCKTCVPKPWKVALSASAFASALAEVKEAEAKPDPVDTLTTKLSTMTLDYPIVSITSLSLTELQDTRTKLMAWMKGKPARSLVPYYNYRMTLEAAIRQKK